MSKIFSKKGKNVQLAKTFTGRSSVRIWLTIK